MAKLTHTDETGKARMVNTSEKPVQRRIAVACGHINLAPETTDIINRNLMKKGDVLTVAEIAGIQAAKKCSELIPLCHNLILDHISVTLKTDESGVAARSEVNCTGRTGVEMEALTAVNIALLTVYDMCKAVDKAMVINDVHLEKKEKYDLT
jgi:cyclic pyranopterin monophosphate synthase